MEDPIQKSGMWARMRGWILPGPDDEEDEEIEADVKSRGATLRVHPRPKYNVSVRMDIRTYDDAKFAGDGLKEGTQQIINLSSTAAGDRQRVVDYLSGVVHALDGTLERLGDDVFLFAPSNATINLAPGSGRS